MQQSGVIETKKCLTLSIVQYTSGDEEPSYYLPSCRLNNFNEVSMTDNESTISVMFLTRVL